MRCVRAPVLVGVALPPAAIARARALAAAPMCSCPRSSIEMGIRGNPLFGACALLALLVASAAPARAALTQCAAVTPVW